MTSIDIGGFGLSTTTNLSHYLAEYRSNAGRLVEWFLNGILDKLI